MTTVDYLELGRDLTRAHAEHLAAGDPDVTVESILIDAQRCPSCAGPLLHVVGESKSYCVSCGSEVDRP